MATAGTHTTHCDRYHCLPRAVRRGGMREHRSAATGAVVQRARRRGRRGPERLDAGEQAATRRGPLPRGRRGRPPVRRDRRQGEARPHLGRRPREPAGHPRPGPDVRRAVACSTPARARPPSPPSPTARCRASATRSSAAGSTAAPRSPAACSIQLAGRLRKANDVVADLVFSDVPGRVAKALLDLSSRFGRVADDGIHVHHDLTQEELAQLVGASRETVNKALADFASRGWLRLEARSVVILDLERLKRRATHDPSHVDDPPTHSMTRPPIPPLTRDRPAEGPGGRGCVEHPRARAGRGGVHT